MLAWWRVRLDTFALMLIAAYHFHVQVIRVLNGWRCVFDSDDVGKEAELSLLTQPLQVMQ
jgi:hypothetical protein